MKRSFRRRLALGTVLGLALLVVAAAGCSKKVANDQIGQLLVDYPEGTRGSGAGTPSDLVVWPDVPVEVEETWSSARDSLVYDAYRTGLGAMQGLIVDYVQSTGYQLFREEEGGGYRQFADFSVRAARRWADRSYYGGPQGAQVLNPGQLFAFADRGPNTLAQKAYVGRAVITGLSSATSPLTNRAATPDSNEIPPLLYTGVPQPPDSLIPMSWEAIPGAASYWVHIYQKRADINTSDKAIGIAQPSPVAQGQVRDLFIGRFPGSITAYKLGDPPPAGSRILVYRVLPGLQEVLVRVSAVNDQGRMIATTGSLGDRDSVRERIGNEDRLRKFLLGALRVTPGRPLPPD